MKFADTSKLRISRRFVQIILQFSTFECCQNWCTLFWWHFARVYIFFLSAFYLWHIRSCDQCSPAKTSLLVFSSLVPCVGVNTQNHSTKKLHWVFVYYNINPFIAPKSDHFQYFSFSFSPDIYSQFQAIDTLFRWKFIYLSFFSTSRTHRNFFLENLSAEKLKRSWNWEYHYPERTVGLWTPPLARTY